MTTNPTQPKSLPVLQATLTLNNLAAINIYRRTFERMDWFLYLAVVLVRVRGEASRRYQEEIRGVTDIIEGLLSEARDSLEGRLKHWSGKLGETQPEFGALGYTHVQALRCEMRTPQAAQFVKLIRLVDEITNHMDRAWYAGKVGVDEQLSTKRGCQLQLLRLTRRVSTLARGLGRRVTLEHEKGALEMPREYVDLIRKRGAEPISDERELETTRGTMDAAERAEIEEARTLSTQIERQSQVQNDARNEKPDAESGEPAPDTPVSDHTEPSGVTAVLPIDSGDETLPAESETPESPPARSMLGRLRRSAAAES